VSCSATSKTNSHGTIPSKYREKKFDLSQAVREVIPMWVRELQSATSKKNSHATIPSKYREKKFDLVQAVREVIPLSLRELQAQQVRQTLMGLSL
jgi:hypothetical protein